MEYAQLNQTFTEAIQVTTHGNVEWDKDNFCSAEALIKDGKAEQFRVVPLLETLPPDINLDVEMVFRDGCEFINNQWQYKWTVNALSEEQIDANQVTKESSRIASLWQAAHDYEYAQISGSAIGLLAIGVLQKLPKCLAVQSWIKSIWNEYYIRKSGTSTDTDFSVAGLCPYSVPELMEEIGV